MLGQRPVEYRSCIERGPLSRCCPGAVEGPRPLKQAGPDGRISESQIAGVEPERSGHVLLVRRVDEIELRFELRIVRAQLHQSDD